MVAIKANFTDFGLTVKMELARQRKTQNWLAEKMGVSSAYVSNILIGVSCPDERIEQIRGLLWDDENRRTEVAKESS